MTASVGGLMSQRNIAIRMVSPGPAASKSRLGRSSTVGSSVTVRGEVKQTSMPSWAAHPVLPGGVADAVRSATASLVREREQGSQQAEDGTRVRDRRGRVMDVILPGWATVRTDRHPDTAGSLTT